MMPYKGGNMSNKKKKNSFLKRALSHIKSLLHIRDNK